MQHATANKNMQWYIGLAFLVKGIRRDSVRTDVDYTNKSLMNPDILVKTSLVSLMWLISIRVLCRPVSRMIQPPLSLDPRVALIGSWSDYKSECTARTGGDEKKHFLEPEIWMKRFQYDSYWEKQWRSMPGRRAVLPDHPRGRQMICKFTIVS